MRPAATTALLGLLLVLAAALFDAEPLYVPGIAFLALVAATVTWVQLGSRGLIVTRAVGARRVLEDQPVAVDVTVRAGPLGLPTGVLVEPLLPAPTALPIGRRATRVHINARFSRRGRKRLVGTRVVVRDPFGIAQRAVAGPPDAELLVLPRIEPVAVVPGDGDAHALGTRRGRPFVAAEIDLDGLRPHRIGTPASRIFWPAVARGGEMMERRLRADSDTRPLVVLDPRAPASEEALDAAVRATASLCVHLAPRGGCAILLPGDRRPAGLEATLAGWSHIHARLALVSAAAIPALAGVASRRGPVIYVAARVLSRPPRALAHAPGGGRLLVVPGTLPGRRAAFTVAGCTGYELSVSAARAHAEAM
jgi:uncharacterized protein (DUF58 family)